MKPQLKPLNEQVIVITGASSGIGLATARSAVQQGAKVVLAARSLETLNDIVNEIKAAGGQAVPVMCDVASRADIDKVAQAALAAFGRVDTWINDAGVSIYGRVDQTSEEDARRPFDTNVWGVFNGSLAALPILKRNSNGGALINLGSEASEAVVALQGVYSASKHAVKGLTDALRVEIEEVDQAPIAITLIQPTAVDTPYPEHARNYMDKEAKLPTPMVDAQKVADAILECAVTPTRSKKVGAMSVINTTIAKIAPSIGDKMAAKQATRQQYDERPRNPEGALHNPSESTGVVGQTQGTGGREEK